MIVLRRHKRLLFRVGSVILNSKRPLANVSRIHYTKKHMQQFFEGTVGSMLLVETPAIFKVDPFYRTYLLI